MCHTVADVDPSSWLGGSLCWLSPRPRDVASTTAVRWMQVLEEAGLLERSVGLFFYDKDMKLIDNLGTRKVSCREIGAPSCFVSPDPKPQGTTLFCSRGGADDMSGVSSPLYLSFFLSISLLYMDSSRLSDGVLMLEEVPV